RRRSGLCGTGIGVGGARHSIPRLAVAVVIGRQQARSSSNRAFKIGLAAVQIWSESKAARTKEKAAGSLPPPAYVERAPRLAEQLQHTLLRLVGQRQRRDRDRLTGRQRLAVGGFLVGVGQRQVGRTGLQHVDQILREVLTDLHNRQIGA